MAFLTPDAARTCTPPPPTPPPPSHPRSPVNTPTQASSPAQQAQTDRRTAKEHHSSQRSCDPTELHPQSSSILLGTTKTGNTSSKTVKAGCPGAAPLLAAGGTAQTFNCDHNVTFYTEHPRLPSRTSLFRALLSTPGVTCSHFLLNFQNRQSCNL